MVFLVLFAYQSLIGIDDVVQQEAALNFWLQVLQEIEVEFREIKAVPQNNSIQLFVDGLENRKPQFSAQFKVQTNTQSQFHRLSALLNSES